MRAVVTLLCCRKIPGGGSRLHHPHHSAGVSAHLKPRKLDMLARELSLHHSRSRPNTGERQSYGFEFRSQWRSSWSCASRPASRVCSRARASAREPSCRSMASTMARCCCSARTTSSLHNRAGLPDVIAGIALADGAAQCRVVSEFHDVLVKGGVDVRVPLRITGVCRARHFIDAVMQAPKDLRWRHSLGGQTGRRSFEYDTDFNSGQYAL